MESGHVGLLELDVIVGVVEAVYNGLVGFAADGKWFLNKLQWNDVWLDPVGVVIRMGRTATWSRCWNVVWIDSLVLYGVNYWSKSVMRVGRLIWFLQFYLTSKHNFIWNHILQLFALWGLSSGAGPLRINCYFIPSTLHYVCKIQILLNFLILSDVIQTISVCSVSNNKDATSESLIFYLSLTSYKYGRAWKSPTGQLDTHVQ